MEKIGGERVCEWKEYECEREKARKQLTSTTAMC